MRKHVFSNHIISVSCYPSAHSEQSSAPLYASVHSHFPVPTSQYPVYFIGSQQLQSDKYKNTAYFWLLSIESTFIVCDIFFYNLLNTKEISKIITFTRLGFPVIYVTGLSMLVITCNTTPSIVYITINCIIRQVFVTSATPRGTTSTVIFRKPWTFRFYKWQRYDKWLNLDFYAKIV